MAVWNLLSSIAANCLLAAVCAFIIVNTVSIIALFADYLIHYAIAATIRYTAISYTK